MIGGILCERKILCGAFPPLAERRNRIVLVRLIQDIESIQSSYGEAKSIAEEIAMQHQNLLSWAQIFDAASIPEKKVIASQIIKAVTLTRNYGIQIEFRISEAQFLNGMDMS